jgi:hypothetical protein
MYSTKMFMGVAAAETAGNDVIRLGLHTYIYICVCIYSISLCVFLKTTW